MMVLSASVMMAIRLKVTTIRYMQHMHDDAINVKAVYFGQMMLRAHPLLKHHSHESWISGRPKNLAAKPIGQSPGHAPMCPLALFLISSPAEDHGSNSSY